MTKHVIGLDPSLTGTGIACDNGQLRRIGSGGVTNLPIREQLGVLDRAAADIYLTIIHMCDQVELVVIEALDMAQSYGGAIQRVVLWWKIVERLDAGMIPVVVAASVHRRIYATGNHAASKRNVLDSVRAWYPRFEVGSDDNLADAVVFMAMGLEYLGRPLAELPLSHRQLKNRTKIVDRMRSIADSKT